MKNENGEIIELEERCPSCIDGRAQYEERGLCTLCGGSGLIPTEIGTRILSLMRHNARLIVTAEFGEPARR